MRQTGSHPLNVVTPNNPDVYWLQLHATRRSDEPIPPQLSNTGISNGRIELAIHGADGRSYEIQSSPDMVHWQSVTTVEHLNGEVGVNDQTEVTGSRFYRAKSAL